MKHVFIMGNKLSGVQTLIQAINLHPQIFIASEADVAWILYCLSNGEKPSPHPRDGGQGLRRTMSACWNIIGMSTSGDLGACGDQIINALAKRQKKDMSRVAVIGDHKQTHADPMVFEFLLKLYPESRFIHLVRHPQSYLETLEARRARNGQPPRSREEILESWVANEGRVAKLKIEGRAPIHSLTFESLVTDATSAAQAIFSFVDVAPADDGLVAAIRNLKSDVPDRLESISELSPEAAALASLYY